MNVSGIYDVATSLPPPQVSCPFQTYLSAGKHKFKISIPKPFLTASFRNQEAKRKFYFSNLRLVPDFYNRDAYLYKFDTAEDLNLKLNYDFGLFYAVENDMYPDELDFHKQDTPGIHTLLNELNRWSVTIKPTSVLKPPFVMDWVDLEVFEEMSRRVDLNTRESEYLREFVDANADDYYGEELSDDQHADRLPASLKDIPHVNTFLFPTAVGGENSNVLEKLRVRIAVAPNTKVSFSSKRMMQTLGFTVEQRTGQRFVFTNPNSEQYRFFFCRHFSQCGSKNGNWKNSGESGSTGILRHAHSRFFHQGKAGQRIAAKSFQNVFGENVKRHQH
jgi:hypothetical protein